MTTVDFDPAPSAAIADLTGHYRFDPAHSRIGFVARHAMVTSVRGSFAEFEGMAYVDAANPAQSRAELTIKVASLSTGNDQRDAHLRSPEFFDVDTHPELTFTSTAAEQINEDTLRLTGNLTIREMTKPVAVELTFNGSAKDPYGALRVGFEGRSTISRKDWGLTWNAALESGGFLVSDKIRLELDISAIKVPATA
ncbi:MAG: YceI family protein [Actinobacteria bacterium]|nr:YceI family protein [Actinomycetota bacterium]